jgi:SOS-response transcriptional repressor LexA
MTGAVSHRPLTPKQTAILSYLNSYIGDHGYSPSLAEIGNAFGLSSLATVHKHLENLQAKGRISRTWNGNRSTVITDTELRCPTCGRAYGEAQSAEQPEAVQPSEAGETA